VFKRKSILSLFLTTVFIISVGLTAPAEGQGVETWDEPADVSGIQPLELRIAGLETHFDVDGTIVHVVVVDVNLQGGTQLRFCNIFPYVDSPLNSPPPQNILDSFCGDAVIPDNILFGLDGIVGVPGEAANAISACISNLPTFLSSTDWETIDKRTIIADRPCGETSITLDFDKLFMYISFRDTNTNSVPVMRSGGEFKGEST